MLFATVLSSNISEHRGRKTRRLQSKFLTGQLIGNPIRTDSVFFLCTLRVFEDCSPIIDLSHQKPQESVVSD